MGATLFTFLILFIINIIKTSFVESHCAVPPQFWCEDPQISKDCNVVDQCQSYLRSNSDKPVNFTLYYESLCPDCKRFFHDQFYSAYQKIGKIMNITLVPYGNAKEHFDGKRWIYQCQHGKEECLGNLIETCAINLIRNISIYLPFIHCMEVSSLLPVAAAKVCAGKHQVDIQPIFQCSTSDIGNDLEHKMAIQTDALRPRHQYVPWVTINGVHTETMEKEAESDLIKLICTSYTGSSKPAACST